MSPAGNIALSRKWREGLDQNGGRAKVGKITISAVTQKRVSVAKFHYPEMYPFYTDIILFIYFSFQISFHAFFLRIPHARGVYISGGIIFRTRSTYLHAFSRLHDLFLRYFNVPEIRAPPFAVIDAAVSKSRYGHNKLPARAARFVRWKIAVRPPYKVSALAGTLNVAKKKIRNCAQRKKDNLFHTTAMRRCERLVRGSCNSIVIDDILLLTLATIENGASSSSSY